MRTKTAEKVTDLLGLVELWLSDGRPRKPPGKPRPDATTFDGYDLKSPSLNDIMRIKNVSLPIALRLAAKEQGYGRHVQRIAALEILWAYDAYCMYWDMGQPMKGLAAIDNGELDTRTLLRATKSARRCIESCWLS